MVTKMVLPSGLVLSPIINTDLPAILNTSRNQLILLILDHGDPRFLGDHVYRTDVIPTRLIA